MRQFRIRYIGALVLILIVCGILNFLLAGTKNVKTYNKQGYITATVKKNDNILMLKTYNQSLSIYLENEKIYELKAREDGFFGKRISGKWSFVDISNKKDNDELKIVCDDTENNKIEMVLVDSRKSAFFHVLKKDIFWLMGALWLFGNAIIFYMVSVWVKKFREKNKIFLCEAFFLIIGIWLIMESESFQFIVRHEQRANIVYCELIISIGISILLYIRENIILEEDKRLFKIGAFLSLSVFICDNILYIDKGIDLSQTMIFSKVLLIVLSILVMMVKREKRKTLLYADILIIADIVMMYMKLYREREILLKTGSLIVMIVIVMTKFFDIKRLVLIGEKVDEWEKLAHCDTLTGTFNRAAYEECLEDIVENQSELDSIAIISCDINNLKKVNDKYGHSEGDGYLVKCINEITNVVGEKACVYRTGGDEFVIVINPYEKGQLIKCAVGFEKILRTADTAQVNDISFAYGYAYYKSQMDKDIMDTIKRADKNMYEKKMEMKRIKEENIV